MVGSDQRQRSFFDHISSFWSAVLPDRHALRNGDVADSQMLIPVWLCRDEGLCCLGDLEESTVSDGWRLGVVVSVVGRINEVNQHQARLVHDG